MSPRRTNQYSYTAKDGECNDVRTCVVKPLFHCDNDVTLQPCCVMFSHVRPLLVWVAWSVWEEEALITIIIYSYLSRDIPTDLSVFLQGALTKYIIECVDHEVMWHCEYHFLLLVLLVLLFLCARRYYACTC